MEDKEKKKQRNRITYLKNRASILERARERYRSKKVVTLRKKGDLQELSPNELIRPKMSNQSITKGISRFSSSIEVTILFFVICLSTYFLLRETVAFLCQTEGASSAWIKALVGEGMVVALSVMRFKNLADRLGKTMLLVVLFGYNAVAILGGVWSQGQMRMTQALVAKQTVLDLQEAIQQKQALKDRYISEGAEGLARKYDRQIDSLRDELKGARAEMLKNPGTEMTKVSFSVLSLFRLIVLIGNAFLVSHFSALFRQKFATVLNFQVC